MTNLRRFTFNMLCENCYVLSDSTGECVIIDCGALYREERMAICQYIDDNGLKPVHLLCTHGHFDHCFGNDTIYNKYGIAPEVAEEDLFLINDVREQFRKMTGEDVDVSTPPVGHLLSDGEYVSFGTHRLQVISTPGHSPGGVVFYCKEEKLAFTGDTLFRMSIGRTDFERSSYSDIANSLSRLRKLLPPDTTILSGHGPASTMADELQYNPYWPGA